jgi:hypothetical protein
VVLRCDKMFAAAAVKMLPIADKQGHIGKRKPFTD